MSYRRTQTDRGNQNRIGMCVTHFVLPVFDVSVDEFFLFSCHARNRNTTIDCIMDR